MSREHDEEMSLYAELGIPHEFLPDEQAPPVDEELLRRLARRELSAAEAEQVHALLVKFRCWAIAYADVLGRETAIERESPAVPGSLIERRTRIGELLADQAASVPGNRHQLADLLAFEYGDLRDYLSVSSGSMSTRATHDPIQPYLGPLRELICQRWGWPRIRQDSRFSDPLDLAASLADLLAASQLSIPFPVNLTTVVLIKFGLDRLCKKYGSKESQRE